MNENKANERQFNYTVRLKEATRENLETLRGKIIKAIEEKNLQSHSGMPEIKEIDYQQYGLNITCTKAMAVLIMNMPMVAGIGPRTLY